MGRVKGWGDLGFESWGGVKGVRFECDRVNGVGVGKGEGG